MYQIVEIHVHTSTSKTITRISVSNNRKDIMDLNNITVEQYYTDNADSKDYYISSKHNLAETPITSGLNVLTFKAYFCNI